MNAPEDSKLDSVLDAWEAARAEGRSVNLNDLCGGDSELLRRANSAVQRIEAADQALRGDRGTHAFQSTLIGDVDEETLVLDTNLGRRELHAEGGLGLVYHGQDRVLNRHVAIKFIREQYASDRESRERFQLEREITGRLEHPGVVPVYGVGETGGRLFYTMRFIDGSTMEEAIAKFHESKGRRRVDTTNRQLRRILNQFVTVCQTIGFAHNRGIIHCDIKPDNVMLGRFGETLMVDWGLAIPFGREGVFKQNNEKTLTPNVATGSSVTSGRGAGTPPYMSPEQYSRELLAPSTDIYSLGAVLYKILTGATPFQGTLSEVRNNVLDGRFERPTRIDASIGRNLEAICLKAMALNPQDRYLTAIEMAKDMERALADASVSVLKDTPLQKMGRWLRRHWTFAQWLLFGLLFALLAVLTAAVATGRYAQHESVAKEQALRTTAAFAAKSIGNTIDIRYHILENLASDPQLIAELRRVNLDPQDPEKRQGLQALLEAFAAKHDATLTVRSWSINAANGVQSARVPYRDEKGEVFASIGRNFAYRDYFHGMGGDKDVDDQEREQSWLPMTRPHNSTALESSNDGQLNVVLSVPIRERSDASVLGVLSISNNMGTFADLGVPLPSEQKAMLVDTRQYYMTRRLPTEHRERGEGLVLHHPKLENPREMTRLPHLSDDLVVRIVNQVRDSGPVAGGLPNFPDPVTKTTDAFAAFARITLPSRDDPGTKETGWVVIVSQYE